MKTIALLLILSSSVVAINPVYLFRAHKVTEVFKLLWQRAVEDIGLGRIFIEWDVGNGTVPAEYHMYNDSIIAYNDTECSKMNQFHNGSWYSIDSAYVIFARFLRQRNIDYDFMWVLEADSYIDGNMKRTLGKVDHMTQDLLTTFYNPYRAEPRWVWFHDLWGEIGNLNMTLRYKSFNPVIRLSKALVDVVEANLNKSSGFCEVYLPTIAHLNGLTVANLTRDMNGDISLIFRYLHDRWPRLPNNKNDKVYHKAVDN